MNLFGLSPGELFLIAFVAMIVLGPEKLPETAASIGKWVREFRRATQELTQQFQDENPFAEIQRALNFNEVPAPPTPTADPVEATPEVAEPIAPAAIAAPVQAPVMMGAASSPVVPRSDYFDRPAIFDPIEDRWAHGSLEDFTDRVLRRLQPQIEQAIADEWAHGVPIEAAPIAVPPVASNGHTGDASSDWVNSLDFSSSLNCAAVNGNVVPDVESVSEDVVSADAGPSDPPSADSEVPGTAVVDPPDEPVAAPATTGISLDHVMVRENEPVAVGSAGSSGNVGDGNHN